MNPVLRLDKWLYYARFCKTRSLAQKLCGQGQAEINGAVVMKPNTFVRVGDHLTIKLGRVNRSVIIVDLGSRRGPTLEARELYKESSPPQRIDDDEAVFSNTRSYRYRRPTRREKRAAEKFFSRG